MLSDSAAPEALRATGTDGNRGLTTLEAQRQAQQLGRETRRRGAAGDEGRARPPAESTSRKPLQVADLGDDVRRPASESESTPGWIRTNDLRIRSPLLYPAELRALKGLTVFCFCGLHPLLHLLLASW